MLTAPVPCDAQSTPPKNVISTKAGKKRTMLGMVANIQNATIASEAGQNLKRTTFRLVPAYRARTYTVTA